MSKELFQSTFSVSADVVFRDLDGEAVCLNLATGKYFGLNSLGTHIWKLLEEHGQLEPVLAMLQEEYDAPRENLERDLLRLVDELVDKGLIVSNA
jgi:hypothetical protein